MSSWITRLSLISLMFAFCVILLGAYTRLADAGLGCPDWPGCYGQLSAPSSVTEIMDANRSFPFLTVNTSKARTEMTHRYFAETLGMFIVVFSLLAFFNRQRLTLPMWLPATLVALVIFQGLLGMWTVTFKLLPLAVLSHLIGGFCTLGLLWLAWLYLSYRPLPALKLSPNLALLSKITLGVLAVQIILGGWTSANYAALICPDFPMCQGQWWPAFNLYALNFFSGVGSETPLALMDFSARTSIHIMHRVGAICTLILGAYLAFNLWQQAKSLKESAAKQRFQRFSVILALLLAIQAALGISNIVFLLPLPIAVAHNGIAALLLLTLIALNFTFAHTPRRLYV